RPRSRSGCRPRTSRSLQWPRSRSSASSTTARRASSCRSRRAATRRTASSRRRPCAARPVPCRCWQIGCGWGAGRPPTSAAGSRAGSRSPRPMRCGPSSTKSRRWSDVRVYISVDMEGIAGISHDAPTQRGDLGYPAAVALMVGEANAAIEGAFDGGATDVLVNDSHGQMFNLTPQDIDPRAVLLQGQKPWSMVAGAGPDRGFEVALFVGYHTRAGHPTGTIAHTYSGAPTLTTLQGRTVGEAGINALALGAWGVPVGLVCGDDELAAETEA